MPDARDNPPRAATHGGASASEMAAALALLAVAVVVVYGGALAYFFSQDDFQYLARAQGLIARAFTPYRPVANLGFFSVLYAIARLNPMPYHAASLALHAVACTLAYGYLRRFHSVGAAAIGTVFFAVHPALFTALYWVSAVNVPLMWVGALAALHAERLTGSWRWLAVPLLALALLTRESAVMVPLLAVTVRAHERSLRLRDPVLLAMLAVAAADAAWLASLDLFGMRSGSASESAYHLSVGRHVLENFLSYVGWSVNFIVPTVRGFSDAVDPGVYPWAAAAIAAWAAGMLIPSLRRQGWGIGGAWFAILLVPVLPLAHHAYHYYLYGPLLGVSWCLAAVYAAVTERRHATAPHGATGPRGTSGTARAGFARRDTRTGLAVALGTVVLLVVNGATLVRIVERHPFVNGLRSDPTVDRAIIARNAATALAAAGLPPGITLRFWSPIAIALGTEQGLDSTRETYWERNVRQALFDGLAVKVLFPRVRSVEFVRTFSGADPTTWYAVYRVDGSLGVATPAQLDAMLRQHAASPSQ